MTKTYTQRLSWIVLLEDIEYIGLQKNNNFKIVASQKHSFNNGYWIVEIEPTYQNIEDTEIEDVLNDTGALAIHEPFTSAVITTEDGLEILSEDIYSWSNAGNILLGDMLSDLERLGYILHYYTTKYPEKMITIEDLKIVVDQHSDAIPMENNVSKLFDDIYGIEYEGKLETIWWPFIIDGTGLHLIVIVDEEEDDEDYPLVPLDNRKLTDPYYDDWPPYRDWYDDDYYYRDERFYART